MSRRFLGSTAIYTVSNIAVAGIPFLMLPILTRVLSPADYGTVAIFAMLIAVLGAFTGLSVHGAVSVRYFEQEKFHLPSYVKTCLVILMASTSAVLAILWLLSAWVEKLTQLPAQWLLIAAMVAGAQFVIQIQLSLWQSAGKPIQYGAFRVGQSLFDAGVSLGLVLGLGYLWQGRATGQVLAMMMFMAVALVALYRAGWLKGAFRRDYARNALQFGVPLIPHTIGGLLIAMTDRFMLNSMLGVAETGVYMVALQIAMGLGLVTDSFNRAYAPWLYQNLKSGDVHLKTKIVRLSYLYFVVVLLVSIVLGMVAPYLLLFLVGKDYLGASGLIVYLALGYAFGGMYYMVTNYVFLENRTASLAIVTLLSGVFNVMISFFLIRHHGAEGAAQGFMLSQAVLFIGTWWLANKVHKMPWLDAIKVSKFKLQ
jgi:O-antigen/teichoic acid export membrane protein